MTRISMDDHIDAVTDEHRFSPLAYGSELWTFEHLEAFAFHTPVEATPGNSVSVTVVVFFSNHCFTREVEPGEVVDEAHVVMDGSIRRILDRTRYTLSRDHLPRLIEELQTRPIKVADPSRPNFVTFEVQPAAPGVPASNYAVFFEVKRDSKRNGRLLLRVQSGYLLERLTHRLRDAKKMSFRVILKNAYTRRR